MKYVYYKYVRHSLAFLSMLFVLASCSDNDYLNAIPKDSAALLSIDATQFSSSDNDNIAKSLLGINDIKESGLDLTERLFMFETADGSLGLCAKVNSESDLKKTFKAMSGKGKMSEVTERRGCNFSLIGKSWLAGFNDDALIVLGPITLTNLTETQNSIARMLKQGEDDGITVSPLYEKIDSMQSPMALVAEIKALPEKIVAPFIIGAPKDTDPSDVILAAEINKKGKFLYIDGTTFSLDKEIDKTLKASQKIYRPIKGKFLSSMSKSDMAGIFLNVDGNKFLPLLQNDKGLQALLNGINTAIDINKIIKSFNGDLAIVTPKLNDNTAAIRLSAETADSKWLSDVDYWKESVPKGGVMSDWGTNAYYYKGGSTSYYFGVTANHLYYSGGSAAEAEASIKPSKNAIDNGLISYIKGNKMVMVINLSLMNNDSFKVFSQLVSPLLGKVDTIIYRMK